MDTRELILRRIDALHSCATLERRTYTKRRDDIGAELSDAGCVPKTFVTMDCCCQRSRRNLVFGASTGLQIGDHFAGFEE